MQHHPPRFLFAWHDEARGIQKVWFQFTGLFETVVDDLGMNDSAVPKLAGANAMQFPFRKFRREFRESRPQFSDALDVQISPDVKNFLGRRCRFSLLVDGFKRLGVGAIESGGEGVA